MSVFAAAGTLGELSQWRLTNLEYQKILWVAHVLHLGRSGHRLFSDSFEAWDYGPVVPALYHAVKTHRDGVIPPFTDERLPSDSPEYQTLCDAFAMTKHLSAGQLITYTHRPGGAWEQHFVPGGRRRLISDETVKSEFAMHMVPSDAAVAWAEEMADEFAQSPATYLGPENERAFGSRVLSALC
jgi:uncharacterized phage-associated protein